ncbi:hypothetical protein [Mesorhizobium sp.]|uniref:hypothetical protein n=1 Tax=Mesorhizobium sp. TaxID=1871066 RepID=UPI00257C27AE|nr:hypothetical protein [Mesorhizobium sp.]
MGLQSQNLRRTALLDLLANQAKSPAIANVLFVRLVILDRVEHFGENPPYVLLTFIDAAWASCPLLRMIRQRGERNQESRRAEPPSPDRVIRLLCSLGFLSQAVRTMKACP